jgi:protein-S-isoprenylcysteine O-methyltransferase Ste14
MVVWRWRNVPLPEAHLGGLGVGVVLHLVVPWSLDEPWAVRALGGLVLLAGLSLAALAVTTAAAVNLAEPERIVSTGVFARSRNPMYIAWTLIYVGVALVVGIGWPLALLPVVLLAIHIAVVREERQLDRRFGAEYAHYRASVRRYL